MLRNLSIIAYRLLMLSMADRNQQVVFVQKKQMSQILSLIFVFNETQEQKQKVTKFKFPLQ